MLTLHAGDAWQGSGYFKLNEGMSVFGRINSGFKFPAFDNLRSRANHTQEVDQYELGLKAGGSTYEMYLTAFYNDFVGLPFSAFTSDAAL